MAAALLASPVTESGGSTNVTGGGAYDSFTVALNTQPTANVAVALSQVVPLYTVATSLTFTTSNYATPRPSTFTPTQGATTGTLSETLAVTSSDSRLQQTFRGGRLPSTSPQDQAAEAEEDMAAAAHPAAL